MTSVTNLALGFVLGGIVGAAGLYAYATSPSEHVQAPAPAKAVADFASLPDWTGIWMGNGGNIFDTSKGGGNVNSNPDARDHPPYKPEWEAAYSEFLETVIDRKSTRLNSSHLARSRMPSSA